jgi:hypothetical protein
MAQKHVDPDPQHCSIGALLAVMWIRNGFNVYPDTDPHEAQGGSQTNADPDPLCRHKKMNFDMKNIGYVMSGLEKTRVFLKKPSPVGFFGFFLFFLVFFWVFWGFFWVF